MDKDAQRIITACEDEWNFWKGNCSGFARAVAKRFDIILPCPANIMLDCLEDSPAWDNLESDPREAMLQAKRGNLVIGGLRAKTHGHVVIVVSGGTGQIPVAYWGRFGGIGRKRTTLNWSWDAESLSKVAYFATAI